MKYIDFFKLSYKSFVRSPNFTSKLVFKIMAAFGFLFFVLYMFSLVFLAYYGIKEAFPDKDVFRIANNYLFVYFFVVFYVLMYVQFNQMQVKQFMLLPVSRQKIISFHLLKVFIHPVNLVFAAMLVAYIIILSLHGYRLTSLIFWAIGILSLVYVINFLMFFSNKTQFLQALMGILVFVLLIKMKWLASHLTGLGAFFYTFYEKPYWVLLPVFILCLLLFVLFNYIRRHFYIDDAVKAHQKTKMPRLEMGWMDKFGLMGSLIKNDIRLILRNVRPRQGLIGFFIFFIFSLIIFSKHGESFKQPEFNKILFLMMLTGYFIMQFGNFIPAWDSEYYPLLMTQRITYRQYLEAKWWLLFLSVVLTLVLMLPFLVYGFKLYLLILALAVFNAGVNIPLVLYSGSFRVTPIRLNQKVKAFQNNENFSMKNMLLGILRLIVPILIYFLVRKYAGFNYAVAALVLMGILGLVFKEKILDILARQYIKRKYRMLSGFKKNDE